MTKDELNELGAPTCVAGRLIQSDTDPASQRYNPDFLEPCQNDGAQKLVVIEGDGGYLVMHLCKWHADLMEALGIFDNDPHP